MALNRRDYVGSTLFTPEELSQLNSLDPQQHKTFLKARGLEIAHFLGWIIREQNIPKASEDGSSGGVALLGWSAGNITTLAFLRHLDSYPSEVVAALEPYVRTNILYGMLSITHVKYEEAYSLVCNSQNLLSPV